MRGAARSAQTIEQSTAVENTKKEYKYTERRGRKEENGAKREEPGTMDSTRHELDITLTAVSRNHSPTHSPDSSEC